MDYHRLLDLLGTARSDAVSLDHIELAESLADAEFLAISRMAEHALQAGAVAVVDEGHQPDP